MLMPAHRFFTWMLSGMNCYDCEFLYKVVSTQYTVKSNEMLFTRKDC